MLSVTICTQPHKRKLLLCGVWLVQYDKYNSMEDIIMNRPMTTTELFLKIQDILKEKNRLPNILDYGIATKVVPIKTCALLLRSHLMYGESEGIFLDLWIEMCINGKKQICALGTFKTLDSSAEAMYIMAKFLADFIIEEDAYVRNNPDDFTWEGVDVYILGEDGKKLNWGYTCCDMDSALKKKDELLKKYQQVAVKDNAVKKEIIYCKECEITNSKIWDIHSEDN